ncbi:MAG: hypothetical protein AMXMBFR7_20830 [Planctomycetota bacterium]
MACSKSLISGWVWAGAVLCACSAVWASEEGAPPPPVEGAPAAAAENVSRTEFENLKRDNDQLREVVKQLLEQNKGSGGQPSSVEALFYKSENETLKKKLDEFTPIKGSSYITVDDAVDRKYGAAEQAVTTRKGKLTIGGLVQVWYYSIQNDTLGWVNPNEIPIGGTQYGSNETHDNDSFRMRRTQLRFTAEISDNLTAFVMLDPAREATSYPTFPTNLGSGYSGESAVHWNSGLRAVDDGAGGFVSEAIGSVRNDAVRNGSAEAGRLLEDAWVDLHGVIPHHSLRVGQMKRRLGEEGWRDAGELDFVERAMITQPASVRDQGVMMHGSWWDDRIQYWVGAFNGAGSAFERRSNRSDDNDEKDVLGALQVRPLWGHETWGDLELGYSMVYGTGGEAGSRNLNNPTGLDGLNRVDFIHAMQLGWLMYRPAGPMKGFWLRGEWGRIRDRFAPNQVLTYEGNTSFLPGNFMLEGYYGAFGYRLDESIWGESLKNGGFWSRNLLKPMEFAFRYERMQNLLYQGQVYEIRRIDDFATDVITFGINYRLQGHNAKLQVNYNIVNEDDEEENEIGLRQVREVRNNNLVFNFQLSW